MSSESNNKLMKVSKKICTSIPSLVPMESIKLEKLKDGYTLKASHQAEDKDKKGFIRSSFTYETTEHYGVEVKDVKGQFNKQGFYEVSVLFDEN